MRITDVALAVPNLVIALAVLGFMGPGTANMVLALMLAAWPAYARLSRTLIVSIKRRPYIEAVQLMGARRTWILRRHLIPAALGPVLVYATANVGFIVVSVATLSFLGLGVQPRTPQWGQMLVAGLPFMETSPGLDDLPGPGADAAGHRVQPRGRAQRARPRSPSALEAGARPPAQGGPGMSFVAAGLTVHLYPAAGVVHAVDDVSWSVEAGKTLAIVGESGCGKPVMSPRAAGAAPPRRERGRRRVADARRRHPRFSA